MKQITVQKGRTKILPVSLGYDVSDDELKSEIRVDKNQESDLIATWDIAFETDGTDGELILTLDDSVTAGVTKSVGYMDIKRTTGNEPVSAFDEPLEVLFEDTITV